MTTVGTFATIVAWGALVIALLLSAARVLGLIAIVTLPEHSGTRAQWRLAGITLLGVAIRSLWAPLSAAFIAAAWLIAQWAP